MSSFDAQAFWPSENIEQIHFCPACGSNEREILAKGLGDNVFFIAPGDWELYSCLTCGSAYLNPRPDEHSISQAYGEYYTHGSELSNKEQFEKLSTIRRLRRSFANAYTNHFYGTNRKPENRIGIPLLLLLPRYRQIIDRQFRYLPKPQPGHKLLDVGCGNGDFLQLAKEAGWDVVGIEPDIKALEVAKGHGFKLIHGDIEKLADKEELFDVITISHVIEHVHDPIKLISSAYRLLKPKGILYLETPNIDSKGFKLFNVNWRGLEVPRHLVIFSYSGLSKLLVDSKFSSLKFFRLSHIRKDIYLRSYRISKKMYPYDTKIKKLPLLARLLIHLPRTLESEEFISVISQKQ